MKIFNYFKPKPRKMIRFKYSPKKDITAYEVAILIPFYSRIFNYFDEKTVLLCEEKYFNIHYKTNEIFMKHVEVLDELN